MINQKLVVSGTYTIVVTEASNATITYSLSLERISPPAPDSVPLILNQNMAFVISPPTAQNTFTFSGITADTYRITASVPAGAVDNICFNIYQPDATEVGGPACTNIAFGGASVFQNVTPAQAGTFVVLVYTGSNDSTQSYNVELGCLLGADNCKQPTPILTCSLKDTLSYNATTATLTMNFTLGTPVAATWNAWLTAQNTMQQLWSLSEPITEPAVTITKSQSLAKSGKVGVLSTLTTPTKGITCSNFVLVNTGTP